MEETPLPDYDNPPVVETILGVQFEKLPGFKNPHLGAFWRLLGTGEWPVIADARPLPPQFERFTESAGWGQLQLMLTDDPSSRAQIKSKDGERMIQLQNGRLFVNWLGQDGGRYPRYERVRQDFAFALDKFQQLLSQEGLGEFRPNQWEVTYLNHIPKATVWQTPKDWGFFLPLTGVPTVEGVIQGESFGGGWQFVIPEKRGRLYIEWQHGLKAGKRQEEVVVLTLTARGPLEPDSANVEGILSGLDLGRPTIVRSFRSLMSEAANHYWGLNNASN